ncbi:MAG TPA: deoxyribose-phosphate aldolase [Saprospiraceae bacterium]|nr:deoxyribose-phosphate aldolase [Saprospiraceae bacterium]
MTTSDIARMIDHAVLHPASTDADLRKNCALAKLHGVATVCVKPYHTALAATLLKGTEVKVCAVIGFPHGNSSHGIKLTEASIVIDEGAAEVDMVANIGKVIQEDWEYLDEEIGIIQTLCSIHKVLLKVIFETDFVTSDAHKIKLCELCNKNQVAFVKTSTGFGFVPVDDGHYMYHGATEHDVRLLREHCLPQVQVKASGGIRTLDQLLRFHDLGATRFGTSSTEAIMTEARMRFG